MRREYEDILRYECIYVYGYSNLGRNTYNKLKKLYPENTKGIIVTKYNDKSRRACEQEGKDIYELSKIQAAENTLIILTLNPIFHADVKRELGKYGFHHILICDNEMDDWLNSLIGELPRLELDFLAVSVGQACNLKCRECMNFSPFAERENLRYDVDRIKSDLDEVFQYLNEVDTFHIQGGEPFLYTDLEELLYYCKTRFGQIIKNIRIATNGMIIPQKAVLQAVRETGSVVRISNYPLLHTRAEELTDVLEQNGIPYRLYNFANHTGEWNTGGGIQYIAPIEEDVRQKFYACAWNACYTVENAIIGRCARSIPARSLQDIDIKRTDYIDLNQNYSTGEIQKYFMFKNPMDCCRHCKGSSGEYIRPAVQIGDEEKRTDEG